MLLNPNKELIDQVKQKPFLRRYDSRDLTLRDHYEYLSNLRDIYTVIAEKIKKLDQTEFLIYLPKDIKSLVADRVARLNQDLDFIRPHLPRSTAPDYYHAPAASDVMKKLNSLDMTNRQDQITLLGYLRANSDLDFNDLPFTIKVCNLYLRNSVSSGGGLKFYFYYPKEKTDLQNWQRQPNFIQDVEKSLLVEAMTQAYRHRAQMLDELELLQPSVIQSVIHEVQSFYQQSISFFNAHRADAARLAVTGAAAVTVGAGLSCLSDYLRPGS